MVSIYIYIEIVTLFKKTTSDSGVTTLYRTNRKTVVVYQIYKLFFKRNPDRWWFEQPNYGSNSGIQ